jgi:hypothetical protein
VLIFTSGGEDLAELPTNQFELYEMGIMHAIDRRFFTAYTAVTGVRGGGSSAEGIVYDDALATRTLVQIWQQLFALDRTKALAVQSSLDSEKRERKQSRKKSLDQGEGITTGDMAVHKSVEQGQHRGDNELYDIFREAAKYLNMARHGAARTVLNACELAMPKQLRSIIMALAESNLKLIRDGGSIHNTGLVMLRHVAVVNQQQGRRQFGAGRGARPSQGNALLRGTHALVAPEQRGGRHSAHEDARGSDRRGGSAVPVQASLLPGRAVRAVPLPQGT